MIAWLRGWATTLHIMIFERETYRLLRDYSEFDEDDYEEVDEPGCVNVYGVGLVFASACAPASMSLEDVAATVNAMHPTGIRSKWTPSEDEKFATGQPNPCPCETIPGRTHYLFEC